MASGSPACSRNRPAPEPGLTILLGRDTEGLDPHTSGLVLQTQMALANVYDALVDFDPLMALRPALASAWTNPDERTWDFRLASGVAFPSGGTLTSRDVVFSVLRARDHPRSVLRASLSRVAEVSELGPDRVRVRTKEPDSHLIAQLRHVYVVSRACAEKGGDAALAAGDCGTGSYLVVSRGVGERIDLVANPVCWRGQPAIPRVRLLAACASAADDPRVLQPPRLLMRVDPGAACPVPAGLVSRSRAGLGVWYLGFDLRERPSPGVGAGSGASGNPFRDPRVRAAVANAIDRPRLVRDAFQGLGYPSGQLVPAFVFGFNPVLFPPPRALEKARRLLSESRFPRGFTVRLDLREMSSNLAAPLHRDLGEIGIRVEPSLHPDGRFFEHLRAGASSLFVLRFFCWTGDAQDVLDQVVHSPDEDFGLGAFNHSADREVVPGLDRAIEEARRRPGPAARLAAIQEALRAVAEAHLVVPLVLASDVTAASPEVRHEPRADGFLLAREVGLDR